ncbi:MAG: HAD-IA family hydrolase [Chloroflexi bacterium]|nr:HAD-IA family hydrolase [Chloroflexota bacterium]
MIKAVLLDMDNTLLHNPDAQFASAFRQLFDDFFRDEFAIDGSIEALRAGFAHMGRDLANCPTNAEALVDCLAHWLPLAHDDADHALRRFYAEVYGQLQPLVSPADGAAALIEGLLEQGLLVAVATNPLYPESAIVQRLEWAGLGGLLNEFAFVTHSENMHFAKPRPEYIAEVVARVGIEPDEALVVGDSLVNDIQSARAIGCLTWHVRADSSLADLARHIQSEAWRENYQPPALQPEMIAPQYRGNLGALRGLLAESSPSQWQEHPDPAEWSILQIVCHLWTTETAVHQARLQSILAEDDPFLAALPPPGPHVPPCHDDANLVLQRFNRDRQATLSMLGGLTPAQWLRPARHSIFGLTTLLEMAYFTAQHDRLHITQLCQTLGKCADEAALS